MSDFGSAVFALLLFGALVWLVVAAFNGSVRYADERRRRRSLPPQMRGQTADELARRYTLHELRGVGRAVVRDHPRVLQEAMSIRAAEDALLNIDGETP